MDIVFLGHSSFKITGKAASLVTDPFDPKGVGLKYPKVKADIVSLSHHHEDHNKFELVEGAKKVIDGPGEYEVEGISLIGIPTFHDNESGELRGKNTVFVIEVDGIRIAHLGDLGHLLSETQIEAIGQIDVLMLPVGGEYTIGHEEAVKIVRGIEPKIIIPMHYQVPGLNQKTFAKLDGAEAFISSLGLKVEEMNKLSVRDSASLEAEQLVVKLSKR